MSKSILDYFGSKLKTQQVKKPGSETPTTNESISDSEIGQESLIEDGKLTAVNSAQL